MKFKNISKLDKHETHIEFNKVGLGIIKLLTQEKTRSNLKYLSKLIEYSDKLHLRSLRFIDDIAENSKACFINSQAYLEELRIDYIKE